MLLITKSRFPVILPSAIQDFKDTAKLIHIYYSYFMILVFIIIYIKVRYNFFNPINRLRKMPKTQTYKFKVGRHLLLSWF
jgi:hypothetical protein